MRKTSLPSLDYGTPRVMASEGDNETSESSTDRTPTFESDRASVEPLSFLNATQSFGSALILNRTDESAADLADSEAVQPEATSEQMFPLLGVALMSVAIALGLYAVIGGSVAALWRACHRKAVSHSSESMVVVRSARWLRLAAMTGR